MYFIVPVGDEASDEDVSYTRTRRRLRRASDEGMHPGESRA